MSLEVDSACHTECSMKAIRNGHGLFGAAALLALFVLQYAVGAKNVVSLRMSVWDFAKYKKLQLGIWAEFEEEKELEIEKYKGVDREDFASMHCNPE